MQAVEIAKSRESGWPKCDNDQMGEERMPGRCPRSGGGWWGLGGGWGRGGGGGGGETLKAAGCRKCNR